MTPEERFQKIENALQALSEHQADFESDLAAFRKESAEYRKTQAAEIAELREMHKMLGVAIGETNKQVRTMGEKIDKLVDVLRGERPNGKNKHRKESTMKTITRSGIHNVVLTDETRAIRSIDLRHEADELNQKQVGWEYARYLIDGEATAVDVLFVPSADRAGVAWGADADWTDASSLDDAIERYFGIDGKEMVR